MKEQLQSPPRLDTRPEWLASRRDHLVREIERFSRRPPTRRPLRIAALAFAVLAAMAGVTVAAAQMGLLGWLHTDNSSHARFLIDPSRTYEGGVPSTLACETWADALSCAPGENARWVYELLRRISPDANRFGFPTSRDAFLADMNRRYAECPDERCRRDVAEARRLAHRVDDEFFAAMDAFFKLEYEATEDAFVGIPGEPVRVPPPGVPRFVTCEEGEGGRFRCVDLSGATGIPLHAPIYELRPSDEWVERPNPGLASINLIDFLESRMERPLTPHERQFLFRILRHD